MQQKRNFAAKLIRSLVVKSVPQPALAAPEKRCVPLATGTFIQSWLCAGWNDEQWNTELNDMKAVGITTLIFGDTAAKDRRKDGGKWTTYYPSALPALTGDNLKSCCGDVLEKALQKCKEHGIGVYIGFGGYADWFCRGGIGSGFLDFCSLSGMITDEIYRRYYDRYPDVIKGWYFVPEFFNAHILTISCVKKLAGGVNSVLERLTVLNPRLPLMMSPFYTKYNGAASFEATRKFWNAFFSLTAFRPGDIFAPQDAVGAGWIDLKDSEAIMQMYRAAVDKAGKGVRLWANCENFTQCHKGLLFGPDKTENTAFIPADPARFQKQLQIVSPYVENIITFSYNHYCSPQTVGSREYYDAYADYYKKWLCFKGEAGSTAKRNGNSSAPSAI